LRTFTVIHNKDSVKIETNHAKFESLERLMMVFTSHFLEKGKVQEIESLLNLLSCKIESHKEWKRCD
jgi:hypothetical protein